MRCVVLQMFNCSVCLSWIITQAALKGAEDVDDADAVLCCIQSTLLCLFTFVCKSQAALKGAEDVDDADAAARAEQEVQVEMDEFTKVCVFVCVHCVCALVYASEGGQLVHALSSAVLPCLNGAS